MCAWPCPQVLELISQTSQAISSTISPQLKGCVISGDVADRRAREGMRCALCLGRPRPWGQLAASERSRGTCRAVCAGDSAGSSRGLKVRNLAMVGGKAFEAGSGGSRSGRVETANL